MAQHFGRKKALAHFLGVLVALAVLVSLLPKAAEEVSLAGKRVSVNDIRWGASVEEEADKIESLALVKGEGLGTQRTWKSPSSAVELETHENRIVGVFGDRLTVGGVIVLQKGQKIDDAPRNLASAFHKLVADRSGRLFGLAETATGERYLVICGVSEGRFDAFHAQRAPNANYGGYPDALFK